MRDIYKIEDNFCKYKHVSTKCEIKGSVSNPLISIYIPTFKRPETIVDTIKSAINQVGNVNYEIIIINNDPDECDGNLKKIIDSFDCPKIYYYVNSDNIGLCGNWNRGIEIARGKYVSMIHDDDILSPWFLDSMVTAIHKKDYPDIIGVKTVDFDSRSYPDFIEPSLAKYRNISKKSFFWGRYISVAGMTVKRDLALRLGGYSEEFYPNVDTIFIYQALIRGRVVCIENILAGYRKEINLSLSDGMMHKIICYTEMTRRNISQHERFAKVWMLFFDKEYLYEYIQGANNTWGTNIIADEIFNIFGIKSGKPNIIKFKIMKQILRLIKFI